MLFCLCYLKLYAKSAVGTSNTSSVIPGSELKALITKMELLVIGNAFPCIYNSVSQICAVAKTKKFWQATGQ